MPNKNCPFCNNNPEIRTGPGGYRLFHLCPVVSAIVSTGNFLTLQAAESSWNTRLGEAASQNTKLIPLNEELEAIIDNLEAAEEAADKIRDAVISMGRKLNP